MEIKTRFQKDEKVFVVDMWNGYQIKQIIISDIGSCDKPDVDYPKDSDRVSYIDGNGKEWSSYNVFKTKKEALNWLKNTLTERLDRQYKGVGEYIEEIKKINDSLISLTE